MKNTFKFMFVVALSVAMASCGGKTEQTSGDGQDTVTTQTAAPADTTQTAAPADSVGK